MCVGIVILNYNTYDDVVKAIISIRNYVKWKYHIYLVDNHSKDDCVELFYNTYRHNTDISLIMSEKNNGYSSGNNLGICRAIDDGCEAVLIMNPDVELQNDILSIMMPELKEKVVCVAPRIIDIDGKNGQRIRPKYTFKYALFNKKPLYYLRKLFHADNYYQYRVEEEFVFDGFPSGCCFLMQSKAFKDLGFFDENVFLYSEELILGNKMVEKNLKCSYMPKAIVKHNEGSSTRKISNSFIDYHMYVSEYYLLKRYCNLSKTQLSIIKILRILNFTVKMIIRKDDKSELIKFKRQIENIELENYKIVF